MHRIPGRARVAGLVLAAGVIATFFLAPTVLPLLLGLLLVLCLMGLAAVHRTVGQQAEFTRDFTANTRDIVLREIQNQLLLAAVLPFRQLLPPLGGWAITADFAGTVAATILDRKPRLIVEASSGISTLISAYCLEKLGEGGRVIALDHEAKYAANTKAELERHALGHLATVVHAPLKDHVVAQEPWKWYDISVLQNVAEPIDLLIIDGPPAGAEPLARYPALPLLMPRLSADAVILLDDAGRDGERQIVERWLKENPELSSEYLHHWKGTAVLRLTRTASRAGNSLT